MSNPIHGTVVNSLHYAKLVGRHLFDHRGRRVPRVRPDQRRIGMVFPGFAAPRAVTRPFQILFERHGVPAFGFNLGLYSLLPILMILEAVQHRVTVLRQMFPWVERIDIIGHSMGGIIAVEAIERGIFAGLEIRLATFGSPFRGTYAAFAGGLLPGAVELLPCHPRTWRLERQRIVREIPFLTVAGSSDFVLAPPDRCVHPHAKKHVVLKLDHGGLILTHQAFQTAWQFFES